MSPTRFLIYIGRWQKELFFGNFMYDINIVIVNYKMKDDIKRCLNSLFADVKNSGLNIVVHVVDNSANKDGIKDILKKYIGVKYIDMGENIGFGKAQNLGFKSAEARFYLALNPDIEFPPNGRALEGLIKFMDENPSAGIAGPKLLNTDGTTQESYCRFPAFFDQIARRTGLDKKLAFFKKRVDYYLMRDFGRDMTAPVDWLTGAFILARREMAEKIGFFDERYFMYFEDCDWCRRAWRAGWQVIYVHDIILMHGHRRESAGKSIWALIFKNQVARIHIKSWLKYFWKWGLGKEHYGV
jgi:GT2 family glycosyltransferase